MAGTCDENSTVVAPSSEEGDLEKELTELFEEADPENVRSRLKRDAADKRQGSPALVDRRLPKDLDTDRRRSTKSDKSVLQAPKRRSNKRWLAAASLIGVLGVILGLALGSFNSETKKSATRSSQSTSNNSAGSQPTKISRSRSTHSITSVNVARKSSGGSSRHAKRPNVGSKDKDGASSKPTPIYRQPSSAPRKPASKDSVGDGSEEFAPWGQ